MITYIEDIEFNVDYTYYSDNSYSRVEDIRLTAVFEGELKNYTFKVDFDKLSEPTRNLIENEIYKYEADKLYEFGED